MTHWAYQYCRVKWTDETDCLHWFRVISREQFGRLVPACTIDHTQLVRSAAKIMAGNILKQFGYEETTTPREGDGVFLTQGRRSHHLGMVLDLDGKFHVLHALEGVGMVVSDRMDLSMNGWKIVSYWTPHVA